MHAIGIPVLIFLIVCFLTILLAYIWNRFFSSNEKIIRNRINAFMVPRITTETSNLGNNPPVLFFEKYIETLEWYKKLNLLCIQAGSRKNATQIVQYSLIVFFLAFAILLFTGINYFGAILIATLLCSTLIYKLQKDRKKRVTKFEEQLPDALEFLSRALLSGNGIAYAFTMAGDEFPDPLGTEFKITSDQLNYGLPFHEALGQLNTRVISSDLSFFVVSLLIQRDTGGNLADILAISSNTIRERLKLKGKVTVLASEAKLSAKLLTALPFILGGILTMTNYNYMSLLWTTNSGQQLILISAVMIPLGMFFMNKIVDIKV
jgi:tight adherence protein B